MKSPEDIEKEQFRNRLTKAYYIALTMSAGKLIDSSKQDIEEQVDRLMELDMPGLLAFEAAVEQVI